MSCKSCTCTTTGRPSLSEQFLGTAEAARRARVAGITINGWCKRYGIGVKVGGRWRIDPVKLKEVLEGGRHGRPE